MRATVPSPLDFVGTWTVQRRVLDHHSAKTATFSGVAKITPTQFTESGGLTLDGKILNATRAYRLRLNKHSVVVTHPDGAEFVTLNAVPSQTVRHDCGADAYAGKFFFLDADTWVETWRVIGPRKSYTSIARYRRSIAGGSR